MLIRRILVVLSILLASEAAMADDYKSHETPRYTVERTDGAFELRRYAPRLMAEVTVAGSQSQAINAGFRVLAGYIFGANEGAAKVAMTTPVTQGPVAQGRKIAMTTPVTQATAPTASGEWVVQFMMPSEFTLDTLPRPRDASVRFVELPAERQAVVRFSGLAGAGRLAEKEAELRRWMDGQGLTVGAGPFYYFYDPPWTLPWNRRNEVAFATR